MSQSSFIHLHCHTEYSLLDGAIRIPELVKRAAALEMPSVAMTDNGVMYGAVDFYLAAKAAGVNPILGCEMYLAADMTARERGMHRLILLAKDYSGYQSLIHLVSESHLKGFYYKPRIDLNLLAQHTQGLIAISPGMRGPIGAFIRSIENDAALEMATRFKTVFGEDFYLGIHRFGVPMEDVVNDGTVQLARTLSLPLVATNDVYYLTRDDAYLRTVLNCIQTGKLLADESRFRDDQTELFLKTSIEMTHLFHDIPEAVENTLRIAESCKVALKTDQVFLPHFDCPGAQTPAQYLESLVWKGIAERYPDLTPDIDTRVRFELDIITKMDYPIYFLIIYDFLSYAREKQIPIGPGRGSAAGSIVAYALGITHIDPLKYHLLFERFLNPERVSMPDIDLDFCIKRRGEIIEYLVRKYGDDRVSQIITFGSMASRGVVRDVGRVLDVPLPMVDRVAKLIPSTPGHYVSIKDAIAQVPDLYKLYHETEDIRQLLDIGSALEGMSRHCSTHAAGVVISRDPLSKTVPLTKNEGQIVTQYSMTALEKIGLLKMDILGLRNLTVIQETLDLIEAATGNRLNLLAIPLEDARTYDLLCAGNTIGVFQLESQGMRSLIKDLQPRVFEDIIALLALYRPGPLGSGMVSEFISNKSGKTQVKYDLPELEPILKETYGMIVYQEQVMQIASVVGGFSLGQADMLRRAMGKKKKSEMDRLKQDFLDGAKSKAFHVETSAKIFELCYKFAEYGFNKSHSAAYALISYQTAYLKTNYPKEYFTALLSSVLGLADKTSLYVSECRRMGLAVLPPDVNVSSNSYTIVPDGIRFGLAAIKNAGEGAIQSIVDNRQNGPYSDLADFLHRVDLRQVNKRVIESLIKAGALDAFGSRAYLLGVYEQELDRAQSDFKAKSSGQSSLFGLDEWAAAAPPIQLIDIPTMGHLEKLRMEREILGLYVSGHPLDPIRSTLENAPHSTTSFTEKDDGRMVGISGLLTDCRSILTRTNRKMIGAKLEDFEGSISVMVFEGAHYEKCAELLKDDGIVHIRGKLRVSDEEATLICQNVTSIEHTIRTQELHIDVDMLHPADMLAEIKQICLEHQGDLPLYFHLNDQAVLAGRHYWISPDGMAKIESLVGANSTWVI